MPVHCTGHQRCRDRREIRLPRSLLFSWEATFKSCILFMIPNTQFDRSHTRESTNENWLVMMYEPHHHQVLGFVTENCRNFMTRRDRNQYKERDWTCDIIDRKMPREGSFPCQSRLAPLWNLQFEKLNDLSSHVVSKGQRQHWARLPGSQG